MRIKLLILTFLLLFFGASSAFAGDPPIQVNPSNNSTVTSSKVEWQTPSYQLYSPNPYRIQVDDDVSFPSSSINKDYYTDNTSYTPVLTYGTWYWRVKAKDISVTWSDWSSVWSFVLTEAASSPNPSPSSSSSTTSSTNSFTISNIPTKIDSTETFTTSISLSLPNSTNTTFYLKGAFKKKDGSNYFGLTKVGSVWIKNNQTYSDQYKITTDSSGAWNGNLEIMPDILDNGYEGSGDYIFKVGRYSDSGSLNWSNEVNVNIVAQAIEMEEQDEDVLGTSKETKEEKVKSISYDDISLDKYVKVASVASSTKSTMPEADVKGDRNINISSIIGTILVIIGAVPICYAIYKYIIRRNNKIG